MTRSFLRSRAKGLGLLLEQKERTKTKGMVVNKGIVLVLIVIILVIEMADSAPNSSSSGSSEPAVHIVYTEKPQENEEAEAYHLRTLASVLGSEEAAKESLVYSYKTAASGFSAKLTPQQVAEMSKQPGVLQVVPSRTLQLHSGPGIGKLH